MPSTKLSDLEPVTRKQVSLLIEAMRALGHPVRATCTYRSGEEQDELYSWGRTKVGKKVTNAKSGESPHNWRAAADFVFVKEGWNGPWDLLGREARRVGLVWGGDWKSFKDRPHVERKDWKTLIV